MGHFRLVIVFFLFYILIFPLAAQTGPTGQPPGAENANLERLKIILREQNIPFEERSLFAEYGSFASSLPVSLPSAGATAAKIDEGTKPESSPEENPPLTFVLAVPLAGTGSLPEGSASGAEELPLRFRVALGLIEKIRAVPLPDINVLVAFLGDEGSLLPPELQKRVHTGFQDLCVTLEESEGIFPEKETVFLMYLDIQDTGVAWSLPAIGGLVIQPRSAAGVASLGCVKSISGLCAELSIPWELAGMGSFFSGIASEGPAVLNYAHAQGLDAIHVSGGIRREAGAESIGADILGDFLFRYVASLDAGAGRDRRYAVIPLPGKAGTAAVQRLVFLSEKALVLAFLAGGAAIIAAALFFAFRHKKFSKRRLVSLCAAVLLIAGICGSAFLDIRLLPLWVLPSFFVFLAFIFHRPVPILVCTILAYASLAVVGGLLYNNRARPPVKTEPEFPQLVLSGEQNVPDARHPALEESLSVDIQSRIQFETNPESKRLLLNLTLRSRENPIRFDLSLVSAEPWGVNGTPALIYFAPMPYRIDAETRSVEFSLGEGPPNPLSLEIILSGNFSGFLRAEALFLMEDEEGGDYIQRVVQEIPITE